VVVVAIVLVILAVVVAAVVVIDIVVVVVVVIVVVVLAVVVVLVAVPGAEAVAPVVASKCCSNRYFKNEFQQKSLCSICLQPECRSDIVLLFQQVVRQL